MNISRFLVPVLGIAIAVYAYMYYGWQGVALVVGAMVMWVLMNFSRMMKVLERASDRPVGYVDSAVMLNAKLRKRVNMLHVMAMTRSIGEQLSEKDANPEIFRWTDSSGSYVTCEFAGGKLVKWELFRPEAPGGGRPAPRAVKSRVSATYPQRTLS